MLMHNGDNDYTLPPDQRSVWITVDNLSVYVVRNPCGLPEGTVQASIFPLGDEMNQPLGEAIASTEEVEA